MKVIFLDVDGCLNTVGRSNIDKDKIDRVVSIVQATGARIVVSSSRRCFSGVGPYSQFYNDIIKGCGEKLLDYIIGMTKIPNIFNGVIYEGVERWQEIKNWIEKNPVEVFCIIEDVCDMADLESFTIRCDPYVGLTDDGVQKAIQILGRL